MTADEFRAKFNLGEVVASGGPRSNLLITEITETHVSVVPVGSKLQGTKRLRFEQLTTVVNRFAQIRPEKMGRDTQRVLIEAGLGKETTTENYLYGFLREWLKRSTKAGEILPEQIPPDIYVWEGAKKTITVNTYERNIAAREACINHWGTSCKVCGMSFVNRYGIGAGFIHVHHLKPLGEIGEKYKLDPIKDLCPVCPNCHAMLHSQVPVMQLQQLRNLLEKGAPRVQ